MITVSIQSNIDQVVRELGAQIKAQVSYAARKAVVKTAEDVRQAQINEMKDVFDRPTPYTLSSVYNKLIKSDPPTARVWLKDFAGKGTPAAEFLQAQIKGGARSLKRFEVALRSVGALPEGMIAVPATGAKMDSYGNMDRGQIVQILSYFRAFPEAGYKANMTAKTRERMAKGTKKRHGTAYFVGRPGNGKLPLGVWQRTNFGAWGTAIKPVLIFADAAIYNILYNFEYVSHRTIARVASGHFRAALAEAKARGIK
jgi:hypothetical protein